MELEFNKRLYVKRSGTNQHQQEIFFFFALVASLKGYHTKIKN